MDKVLITTDSGKKVEAAAPVIISASRSTDIPAFYAKWFFNRLAKGYCVWYNPFNQQPMYISFKNCKVVVFWTKNPEPIIPYLPELDKRGIHYYFQVTLNDYEQEGFEPNVPSVKSRISTFRVLSDLIGREKVIWRFDPLIVTQQLRPYDLITRIKGLYNCLRDYTDKLVFSFVDVRAYRKVQNNLVKETPFFSHEDVVNAEMTYEEKMEIVRGLVAMRDMMSPAERKLKLATCAEDIDLEAYGIEHKSLY